MRNLIISTAVVALVAVGCGEKKEQASLDSAKFTYVKGDVLVSGKPATLGQTVSKDATIEVKNNSMAVLQFSSAASITLKANSVLSIANLAKNDAGKPVIELSQSNGSSFSKIAKGQSDFSIKTPTAVAGVRGTSFELEVGNGKTTKIKLLEGKVAVAKVEANDTPEEVKAELEKATVVEAGQKVEVDNKAVSKPVEITEAEKTSLQAMNTVEIAPVSGKVVVPESVEKYATGETTSASLTEAAPKAAEVKKLTLADIKAKYGRIAKIQTKNGKEYVGYFNQQGAEMTIQTVDGQVRVPVASVQKVTPMN
ncbi:MAG TPA: FecR domain-containing protein [Turneriella sp.]|nr:FecR domain-containing protein [Turneriella sp.]HNJ64971.1 FecR domain-containing protein [Turneriella sp.]HNL09563.1 FecR domain-containing protein [Turneriella sp.]